MSQCQMRLKINYNQGMTFYYDFKKEGKEGLKHWIKKKTLLILF